MNTFHQPLFRTLICFCMCLSLVVQSRFVKCEIRNGYGKNIEQLKCSLASLKIAAANAGDAKSSACRRLEARTAAFEDEIAYYGLTEILLGQFKAMAPDLYAQIDSIRDKHGRPVDVYVKFVRCNSTAIRAWGTTYMAQNGSDADGYLSEYGEHTVSVKVWTVKCALRVLAHELGHVSHQVPHLADYIQYHALHYGKDTNASDVGHDQQDPSGMRALDFELRFQKQFSGYNNTGGEKYRNPVVLYEEIRRNSEYHRFEGSV